MSPANVDDRRPDEGDEHPADADGADEGSPVPDDEEAPEPSSERVGERVGAPPEEPESPLANITGFLRDRYLTIDRRLLGIFRILFGSLLIWDALRRLPDATFFFSNEGVLPNHFALFAPLAHPFFSIYTAFSTPTEVKVAFVLTALAYVPYVLGYRTKIAQIVALVLITSINCRNIFVENGGCIVVGLLAAWTMFLPLGDRFSIDAVVKSMRARRERTARALEDRSHWEPVRIPHTSLAVLAITLQIFVIYFFNTVHKEGLTWHNGESIHWVLWQNRIATHLAAWVRMHEPSWLSPVMTRATLIIEGTSAFLPLLPFAQRYIRTGHVLLTFSLHFGIALLMTLGPFSYAMILLNLLLLPPEALDAAARQIERRLPSRTLSFAADDPTLLFVARLLARLDPFHKLRFIERGPSAPEGTPPGVLSARDDATGTWTAGSGALAVAVQALPLGFLLAPLLRAGAGTVKRALKARSAVAERFALGRGALVGNDLGAALQPGLDYIDLPAPSPLRTQAVETAGGLREAFLAILLVASAIQTLNQNWWVPPQYKVRQPRLTQAMLDYPRLLQGWSMFSPEAPKDDGTIVVDGVTAEGRHLDPFTGLPPDFEPGLHGPWFQSQFFCDYFLKIHFDGSKGYRPHFRHYLENWQELEGKPPADKLVSFEVWWINNNSPPPGSTVVTGTRKTLLFSSKERDLARRSPFPVGAHASGGWNSRSFVDARYAATGT